MRSIIEIESDMHINSASPNTLNLEIQKLEVEVSEYLKSVSGDENEQDR